MVTYMGYSVRMLLIHVDYANSQLQKTLSYSLLGSGSRMFRARRRSCVPRIPFQWVKI